MSHQILRVAAGLYQNIKNSKTSDEVRDVVISTAYSESGAVQLLVKRSTKKRQYDVTEITDVLNLPTADQLILADTTTVDVVPWMIDQEKARFSRDRRPYPYMAWLRISGVHVLGQISPTIDKRLQHTWRDHENLVVSILRTGNVWDRIRMIPPSPSLSPLESHREYIRSGMISIFLLNRLKTTAGWYIDTAVLQPMDTPPTDPRGVHVPPFGIRAQYDAHFTLTNIGFYGRTGTLLNQTITPDAIRVVESRIFAYQTIVAHAGIVQPLCAGQCAQAKSEIPQHHPLRALLAPLLRGINTNSVYALKTTLVSSPGLFSLSLGTGTKGQAGMQAVIASLIRTQNSSIQNLLQHPRIRLQHLENRPGPARDVLNDSVRWYDHLSDLCTTFVGKHKIVESDPVVVRWKSQIGWAQDMTVAQIATTLAYSTVVHSVVDCDATLTLLTRTSPNIVYAPDGVSVLPGSRVATAVITALALGTLGAGYTYTTLDVDYKADDRYRVDFQELTRRLCDEEIRGVFRCPDLLPSVVETSPSY